MPVIPKKQRDETKKRAKTRKHKGLETLKKVGSEAERMFGPSASVGKRLKEKVEKDKKVPLIEAPKKPYKVPFTGGKAKKTPAVKRFATQGKRGGGMVGRSGIIKGYKKGGQV